MKPGNEFDCVEMKAEIQERLLREVAELGDQEAQATGRAPGARSDSEPFLADEVGRRPGVRGRCADATKRINDWRLLSMLQAKH